MQALPGQLGFDALLQTAAQDNEARHRDKVYGHLPSTMDKAGAYYRELIIQHHAFMLAGDSARVMALREEAHQLATKLNNNEPGVLADDDAPGCVLERRTQAKAGEVPLWGQCGHFEIEIRGMRVAIEFDVIFGIGACHMSWMNFAARAILWDQPILSETGYRSFMGVGGGLEPGFTPDIFAAEVIAAYLRREMKDKLTAIKAEYRR